MKIHNVNCRYAYVCGNLFFSVADAKLYCEENGIDPDVWLEADCPEALEKCRAVAKASLPVLERLKDQYSRRLEAERAKLDRLAKERDKAQEAHELGWEVHQDRVLQQIGVCSGLLDAWQEISKYAMEVWRISRM